MTKRAVRSLYDSLKKAFDGRDSFGTFDGIVCKMRETGKRQTKYASARQRVSRAESLGMIHYVSGKGYVINHYIVDEMLRQDHYAPKFPAWLSK